MTKMIRYIQKFFFLAALVLALLLAGSVLSGSSVQAAPERYGGVQNDLPAGPTGPLAAGSRVDQMAAPAADQDPLHLAWSSAESGWAWSMAWGDVDGDGDLDLAVGNHNGPTRLYRNDGGVLSKSAAWAPSDSRGATSVAWGDVDGDGDLDLATGDSYGPTRLYRNDGGVLTPSAVWSSTEIDSIECIAWGDVDGDGDLDLAVGNFNKPTRLYRNDGGVLTNSAVWSPTDSQGTISIAWGDVDGDGDLDLATGSWLYRNDGGVLTTSAVWSAPVAGGPSAWGDVDGDGDLDLAIGALLYRNDGGTLTNSAVWSATDNNGARSIAWGDVDGDGDLDLATGAFYGPTRLYRNDGGVLTSSAVWSSAESGWAWSIAWGDVDGDGDLDLAVGDRDAPIRLYRNDGGVLLTSAVLSSPTPSGPNAWGDVDGDGDLDLAVGSRLYRNDGGVLTTSPVWASTETSFDNNIAWGDVDGDGDLDLVVGSGLYRNDGDVLTTSAVWYIPVYLSRVKTTSIAWGDVDGDGDLDLAAGNGSDYPAFNIGHPNWLFRNDGGVLTHSAVWSSAEGDNTWSIAWGDIDGDGYLDLAVGNVGQPNRLYHNDGGTLTPSAVWSSTENDDTRSIAWGDVDGDGDLDLAVGNSNAPNRLYRNDGGVLTPSAVWSSMEGDNTRSIAWGDVDGDGDLDLAVGNSNAPNRLYRNDGGTLTSSAAWSSTEIGDGSVAWGDVDGDGDLDLAVGGRIYQNGRDARQLPGAIPLVRVVRPGLNANFYSDPAIWDGQGIPISYTLSSSQGISATIHAEFSLDGGGYWQPAVAVPGTPTRNLPPGKYVFKWDTFANGIFGQWDNVVFRIIAIPDIIQRPNQIPGPYLYGRYASQTFPFRMRGTQVRVVQENNPEHGVPGSFVLRQAKNVSSDYHLISDPNLRPFMTNLSGYLQGHGQLGPGDRLVALAPITATETYTLYNTSASPTLNGLDTYQVTAPGVQTLTVSAANPLVLFNLDVSLEWDARHDPIFLEQLQADLHRTSELLYDWSNGQAALGNITIYHDREKWNDAHLRILATNRLRPNADQGGSITGILTETVTLADGSKEITYTPGQVRMGAVWNRYGNTTGNLGEDWPRSLAHELSHYLFFLDDSYLGLDDSGRLIPVDKCPGVMADPYSDDDLSGFDEFHPTSTWLPGCQDTLSNRTTGRSDWQTILRFFPWLHYADPGNAGPNLLPLAVTRIKINDPSTPDTTLSVPIFSLMKSEGEHYTTSGQAQGFLFHGDTLTSLGSPTSDLITARGARAGDELCVFDTPNRRYGCETLSATREQLALENLHAWQPEVTVTPVTSNTLKVTIQGVSTNGPIYARLYPVSDPAPPEQQLIPAGAGIYTTTFANLPQAVLEGFVRVYVKNSNQQMVTNFMVGGDPVRIRSLGTGVRGHIVRIRSLGAPVLSPDGQMILYGENLKFNEGEFFAIQTAANLPNFPAWSTPVGQAYRLSASPNAPNLSGTSISVSYLEREVPPGEESWLKIYYHNGSDWRALDTRLDAELNLAVASTQGEGLYILATTLEMTLYGPGWNLVSYPIQATRPITDTLSSIDGLYSTVCTYLANDVSDPWKCFGAEVPAWVNDITTLEFKLGYWIYVTQPGTFPLRLKGKGSANILQSDYQLGSAPTPPAVYYGLLIPGPIFSSVSGMSVTAWIDGYMCGAARTMAINDQIVYKIDVKSVSEDARCGQQGRRVLIRVEGKPLFPAVAWDDSRMWEVALSGQSHIWLPLTIHH